MHELYVDVVHHDFDWSKGSTAGKVLQMDFNLVEAQFICNSYGKISKGDCYKVTLHNKEDELFFLLKSGFNTIDPAIVENYRENKWKINESYIRSPRR